MIAWPIGASCSRHCTGYVTLRDAGTSSVQSVSLDLWDEVPKLQILWWRTVTAGSNARTVLVSWCGERLSPLGTSATIWPILQAPDGRWLVWSSRWNRRNRSTRRKPAPVPLCPPQIPRDLAWARTRSAAVEIRRLTSWVMARPHEMPSSSRTLGSWVWILLEVWMSVCVYFVFVCSVLCVGSGFVTGWSPCPRSPTDCV
jgi:hypothetical protein